MRTQQSWTALACLAKDVDIKEFDDGGAIVNARVIINETIAGKERTEGFNVVYRPPRASVERVVTFFRRAMKKGTYVWVVGALSTDTYTDREGVERTAVKVNASTFTLIASARPPAAPAEEPVEAEDSEMPAPPAQHAAPAAPVAPAAPARREAPEVKPPVPVLTHADEGIPFDDPSRW